MTDTPTTITLEQSPEMGPMFRSIAADALPIPGFGRSSPSAEGGLPATTAILPNQTIDLHHVAEYARLCGFRLDSTVPASYLHLLGFPVSMLLMTRDDFPWSLLGLVHVANQITVHRPVAITETVSLSATVTNLRAHPKGQQMDNVVTVTSQGQTVWESVSTYLKRGEADASGEGPPGAVIDPTAAVDVATLPLTARWSVPRDIGRDYGSVSGDRNPIHLSTATAKAFGFKRAIAHGMWTTARSLAALAPVLPDAFTVDVAFKLPVFLPGDVEFATLAVDDAWHFGLRSRDGKPHLVGVAR